VRWVLWGLDQRRIPGVRGQRACAPWFPRDHPRAPTTARPPREADTRSPLVCSDSRVARQARFRSISSLPDPRLWTKRVDRCGPSHGPRGYCIVSAPQEVGPACDPLAESRDSSRGAPLARYSLSAPCGSPKGCSRGGWIYRKAPTREQSRSENATPCCAAEWPAQVV
jgi:hypothetical protein